MSDNIARRLALRQHDSFIIDPIFPNGGLHVISGPPDIGKTTWALQLMYEWSFGRVVLNGCKSHPCKWVYITIDRSLRDTDRTLRRLGLENWDIPAYSMEEIIPRNVNKKIDLEPSIFQIVQRFADVDLFFIEGLQGLLPNVGRGQSMNKAQMLWVMQVRDLILNPGKTIIAVNHTPKSSDAAHDRENMLGSQGLIGGLGTTISFGLPPMGDGKAQGMLGQKQTTNRLVSILMKNNPPMYLNYSRNSNGSFELDGAAQPPTPGETFITTSDNSRILDAHLLAFEGLAEITWQQVNKWGADAGIAQADLIAWAACKVNDGKLVKEGRNYRRTSIQ